MVYSNAEVCLSNAIVCLSNAVSSKNDCSDNYSLACLIGLLSRVNLDVNLFEVDEQLNTLDAFYEMLHDCINDGGISYKRYRSVRRNVSYVYEYFQKMRDSLNDGVYNE